MKNLIKIKVLVLIITLMACYIFKTAQQSNQCANYALDLQSEGWSKSASNHIAKCEYNVIPKDALYFAYMQD